MRQFIRHEGIAAPLMRSNVDTDAIIPSVEMKSVSGEGLAEGLFAGWRYSDREKRIPNPDFVLNQPEYADATILLTDKNFGCGSSREHAVWALADYGFRAVLAPTFAPIFRSNCIANGVLPARMPREDIDRIIAATAGASGPRPITIDLEQQAVSLPTGERLSFKIAATDARMLLNGWDPIELTLQNDERIRAHVEADRQQRPWVYLEPSE